MPDRFAEEIDDAFKRNEFILPTDVATKEDLEREIIEMFEKTEDELKEMGVPKEHRESILKLSASQKEHIIDNIIEYKLAEHLWTREGGYYAGKNVAARSLRYIPEEDIRREIRAKRIGALKRLGRLEASLTAFEIPRRRSEVGVALAERFDRSVGTISRDITPLFRAGYVDRVAWGTYELTDRGRELLESL